MSITFTKNQLTLIFLAPQCPKSEYKASAPVVQRKTAPKIQSALGEFTISL